MTTLSPLGETAQAAKIARLKAQSNLRDPEKMFFQLYGCTPDFPEHAIYRLACEDVEKMTYEPVTGDLEVNTTGGFRTPLVLTIPRLLAINDELAERNNVRGLSASERCVERFCLHTLRDLCEKETPGKQAKAIPIAYIANHAPRFMRRRGPMCGKVL